jgi:MFS family permease
MWGLPSFIFLFAFFHRAAPGTVAKELMHEFDASGTIVGLLAATYFYSYAGFMLPAGVLIDAYGARRVVSCGGAVMGLGTLAMAAARSPMLLFAGRLVIGLGATVTFIGAVKIAAAWFPPARFGTVAAMTATVGLFGSLLATFPLAALVVWVGWRGAFTIVGLVILVSCAACFALVRDHPAPAAAGEVVTPGLRVVRAGLRRVLANRDTWPPFVAFFCGYAAIGNLMLWAIPYLQDVYRLSTPTAALYATIPAGVMLVSAPLTGWLSDAVLRRRKLPYVALTLLSAALWTMHAATAGALPIWGVAALWALLGLGAGAFVLTWPIGREVNPPELAGIAVAVVNLGGFLGAALTQGPLGWVLDARWTGAMAGGARVYPTAAYAAAFWVCAAFIIAAVVSTLFLRETRGRNVYASPR